MSGTKDLQNNLEPEGATRIARGKLRQNAPYEAPAVVATLVVDAATGAQPAALASRCAVWYSPRSRSIAVGDERDLRVEVPGLEGEAHLQPARSRRNSSAVSAAAKVA